ncbi:unnamed protein product [Brassica oleracea var. botrytis]
MIFESFNSIFTRREGWMLAYMFAILFFRSYMSMSLFSWVLKTMGLWSKITL